MAVTIPLVSVGQKITATLINLIASVLSTSQTYTPTINNWSSTGTAPTTTARYWITGNICHVVMQSTLGTGTISVAGITLSVPVPIDTTGMIAGSTVINGGATFDDISVGSTAFFGGLIVFVDANTVRPMRMSTANPGVVAVTSSTVPFTWATGDRLSMSFSYPIG